MKYSNIYETVFSYWLEENAIKFKYISQSGRCSSKRFDFLVEFPSGIFAAEVKGRILHTSTKITPSTFQNWITADDINSLINAENHSLQGLIVFIYRFDNPYFDVEDELIYELGNDKFLLRAIRLCDYVSSYQKRSEKWNTVNICSVNFEKFSFNISKLLESTH